MYNETLAYIRLAGCPLVITHSTKFFQCTMALDSVGS